MHLILNCRTLPSDKTPAFIAHCEALPTHWQLTLGTKPGRDAAIAYECVQRRLPKCRVVAAWSEQELMLAACGGWRASVACWWPCSDSWPDWQAVNHIWQASQRVSEVTGKQCPVGFTGIMANGDVAQHSGCACVACDAIVGPVIFAPSQAGLLLSRDVSGVRDAGLALCLAVGAVQRRACYQAPDYGLRFGSAVSAETLWKAAKGVKWRSRVGG